MGESSPPAQPSRSAATQPPKPGALNAIFMLDLSGSTQHITGLDANFDGEMDDSDDLNGDGRVGDLLDKEIGLEIETVGRLAERTDNLRVAAMVWTSSGATFPDGGEPLDIGAERFNQTFVVPGNDADLNGVPDLEDAVRSAIFRNQGLASHAGATEFREFIIGPGNDFDEALQELLGVMDSAPDADETQVYFFTDGLFFVGEDQIADAATIADVGTRGVQFRAAQVAGPALVAEQCGIVSPPAWCAQVDPGVDFVDEVARIAAGINAEPDSTADIVIAGRTRGFG